MKRKKKEDVIQFPKTLLNEISVLESGRCIPGIVLVNETDYPIVCAKLSEEDTKYFGLDKYPFKYDYRFRYLDDNRFNEIIEFTLRFKKNRILAILLDPINEDVRLFLKKMVERRNFGVYCYCKEIQLFSFSLDFLDLDMYTWAMRNSMRAENLKKNKFNTIFLTRKSTGSSDERYCTGVKSEAIIKFLSTGDELILVESAQDILFSI
jgi:hypothetical protein